MTAVQPTDRRKRTGSPVLQTTLLGPLSIPTAFRADQLAEPRLDRPGGDNAGRTPAVPPITKSGQVTSIGLPDRR